MLAACLLSVAVLVPTCAWYLAGSREAGQRRSVLAEQALAEVRAVALADADRLAARLEALRASEASRPFYQYQNLYHDPRGASQGLSVIPSPLAFGTQDQLIWAHFQIDDHGRVSLPTVNERFPELSADEGFAMYCDFLSALQNGVLLDGDGVSSESPPTGSQEARLLILQRAAWQQNLLADAVYASLTGSDSEVPMQSDEHGSQHSEDHVVIRIGPLQWRTILIGDRFVLAALRQVVTPSGILVQGFALAGEEITAWLGGGGSATAFTLESAADPEVVSVPVGDTGWYLQADARPTVIAAGTAAAGMHDDFLRIFALSTGAALCAALAVVLMVAQADRLARQRARFAAAAAHELKTPLSSLRLYSEMLVEGMGDPQRSRTYAQRIATETARLGRVVTNMLDLSRLERGATMVQLSRGDLAETVRGCLARHTPALQEAGMALSLDIAPELPDVRYDADAVCQILHNLLDNAEVHSRSVAGRTVRVSVARSGPAVLVTVADSGPGIGRRLRRQLFRPFFRADPTANGPVGLGLGLSLARSLARSQGGDLVYDSTNELGGAAFTLSLPIRSDDLGGTDDIDAAAAAD